MWILYLIVYTASGSVQISTAEYSTQKACGLAAKQVAALLADEPEVAHLQTACVSQ